MSFVCPKCGFRDDPRWRNTYFDPHTVIMNWDDFEMFYPHLATSLNGPKRVVELPYAYERSPLSKWPPKRVIRGTIEEFNARGFTFQFGGSNMRGKKFLDAAHRKQRHKETLWHLIGNVNTTPKLHPKEKIANWLNLDRKA